MEDKPRIGLPCPLCPSSDAFGYIEETGWGKCFSCGGSVPPEGHEERTPMKPHTKSTTIPLVEDIEIRDLKARGISAKTCEKYNYGGGVFHGKPVQVACYYDKAGKLVAQQLRHPDKTFTNVGDQSKAGLFGQHLVRSGGKLAVITEGQLDALAVTEAMGLTWPAMSVRNGSGSAVKEIKEQLEFLNTFEHVVILFDNDDPGREATGKVVELFEPGKVKVGVYHPYKDACDWASKGKYKELRDLVWSAKEYRPDGIVNMREMRAEVMAPLKMGRQFPWSGLNKMTYGFRPQELVTWTAGTGVGKSAMVSEVVYQMITEANENTEENESVGIIYLEEGVARSGRRLVGLHVNKPLHLPGNEITPEEMNEAFDFLYGKDKVFSYDHFGSLDPDVLLARIRYMIKGLDCKVVVLDHISMVVSGQDISADERKTLDYLVTKLRSLLQETNGSLHIVSHLRRVGGKPHEEGGQVSLQDLRGTQAIAQLSDIVIAAERNQQASDEDEKNTTTLRVLKNRYAGLTGVACKLKYNRETGRLSECPFEEDEGDKLVTGGDTYDVF